MGKRPTWVFVWPPVDAPLGRPPKGRCDDRWIEARQRHLDAWRASGLTRRAYALEHGFPGGWVLQQWEANVGRSRRRALARRLQLSKSTSTNAVPNRTKIRRGK